MSRTHFSGPLTSGDKHAGQTGGPNWGYPVLAQTQTINFDGTLVQNATFNLPINTQIVRVVPDVTTAYNSATSATLSVGTSSGNTAYVGSVDGKTAGRAVPAYTGAQLASMKNIGTNTTVVATVTSVGQPTAGSINVTVEYVQIAAND